jgi:hypothetical protein
MITMPNKQSLHVNRNRVLLSLVVVAVVTAGCGGSSGTSTNKSAPGSVSTTAAPTAGPVGGSAYGYYSSISLFGGPAAVKGPTPTVTLPAGGSSAPVVQSVPSEDLTYGPAHIFDSGPLKLTTQGTAASGVTSSTSIQGCTKAVNNGCSVGQVFAGPFTGTSVSSTCTAKGSSHTGSVKIQAGQLTEEPAGAGVGGTPGAPITVPTNPSPNYTVTATFPDTGKVYKYVFNEQTVDANGALTVNAAHEYLQAGATGAQGDLIFGRVVCGKSASTSNGS